MRILASIRLIRVSFRFESDLANDLPPALELRLDELARRFRRAGAFGIEAEAAKALHHVRISQNAVELMVRALDHVARRSGGRDEGEPPDEVEARESLRDRRDVLIPGGAGSAADAERTKLAALHERRGRRNGQDHELRASCNRV